MQTKEIGSFRSRNDKDYFKSSMPPRLWQLLHDPVPEGLSVEDLMVKDPRYNKHLLNYGAFGKSYKDCQELANELRTFAD